jgi:hypothetical protein
VAATPGPGDETPLSALADTFDYASAHAAAVDAYAMAVATSPTQLIGPDHPVARTLRTLGAGLAANGRSSRTTGNTRADALAAVVRHLTPGRDRQDPDGVTVPPPPPEPPPLDDVTPVEEADFHQVLGMLRDHPALARALGLVIDLTIPVTDALTGERNIRIAAADGAPLRAFFDDVETPWSRITCSPQTGLFVMATRPGSGTEIVRGMLDLTPTTTKHVIGTVDVEGAARHLGALGAELHRAAVGGADAIPASPGLPARRDTGFTLAQTGRLNGTVKHAAEAKVRYDDPATRLDGQPVLFADDVTAGYRLDVARGNGPFRSLMRRVARYRIGTTPKLVVHDEGVVEPLVAVQQFIPAEGTG